jgi:tRNA-specific 2-thiouridylase
VRVLAKTRYRQKEQPATAHPNPDGSVTVIFDEPIRAITPGQACVLYDGDTVLGGGVIVSG